MSYIMANRYPICGEAYCEIYLYRDFDTNVIICSGCPMSDGQDVTFAKRSDVIEHLEAHRARGDPASYDGVLLRLVREIDAFGDDINEDNTP